MTKYSSTFLLPNNSLWVWAGSILNFAWNYMEFNTSKSPEEADSKEIANDFWVVWNDIQNSMDEFNNNIDENVKK